MAQEAGGGQPIQLRHDNVHHDQVRSQALRQFHSFAAVGRLGDFEAERREQIAHHRPVLGDIVYHQHLFAWPRIAGHGLGRERCRCRLHRLRLDLEAERAALAGLALDRDFAAHQAHILAADRQAQAGAAHAMPHVAGLLERREDSFPLIGRDADAGVLHCKA